VGDRLLLPDYGFFGFLLQDDVGGLQVQNADGEWLDVTPRDNTFVVSLGEMLEVATAGAFTATTHRVLVPQSTRVWRVLRGVFD
jgi:isopenicillin N synthase-like dioxygenase